MHLQEKILAIVSDPHLSDDAWYDDRQDAVVDLLQAMASQQSIDVLWSLVEQQSNPKVRLRLLEAIPEIPAPELFNEVLTQARNFSSEEQIVVMDGVRFWNLDEEQRKTLRTFSETLKGKSELIDKVIDSM